MANTVLLLAFVLQVASTGELNCLGFIRTTEIPTDVYISGTQEEGKTAYSTQRNLVYLSGVGIPSLKIGETYKVIRPEGRIKDRLTNEDIGVYYIELGTVRIETQRNDSAMGMIMMSCNAMLKGDLIVPIVPKTFAKFTGQPSNRLTSIPDEGLTSSIILGKDDRKEMGAGHFCFIAVGQRDGIKPGDRFTIYRPQQPFNPLELIVNGKGGGLSYEKMSVGRYQSGLIEALMDRNLPPRILGGLVIVDVSDTTSRGRIVNSREEIHLGDLVVRR